MVLRGDSTAATAVAARPAAYGGDERYRSYEGEVRTGRAWWPWLLALGAAIALGIGAWLFYDTIQDELDANEPVAVDNYEGILEEKAVALIHGDGFEARVRRLPNGDVERGYVYEQEPGPGHASRRGASSRSSSRAASGRSPSRRSSASRATPRSPSSPTPGSTRSSARSPRTGSPGTVTAQDPRPGTVLVEGSSVRINVSSGPKPVAVPNVVGSSYEVAAAQLQSAGFTVGRVRRRERPPAGEVVAQTPPGNSTATSGLVRDALRLAGPEDRDRPRRLAPDGRRRARDAPRGRLPRLGHAAGHRRRVARRARHVAGPAGLDRGRPKLGRHDHGRRVRAAARRDDPPPPPPTAPTDRHHHDHRPGHALP